MTADQRLDQLEPLVAEVMAAVDRHTDLIEQLLHLITQQHENNQLLLQELTKSPTAAMGAATETEATAFDAAVISTKLGATEAKLDVIGHKFDRIIGLLDKR